MEAEPIDRSMSDAHTPQLRVGPLVDQRLACFHCFVSNSGFARLNVDGNNAIAVPLLHQGSNRLLVEFRAPARKLLLAITGCSFDHTATSSTFRSATQNHLHITLDESAGRDGCNETDSL